MQTKNLLPKNGAINGVKNQKLTKYQDAATQTEILSMNYIPPKVLSGFQLESEAYPSFIYKPHMVFLLIMLCGIIGYSVFNYSEPNTEYSFIHNSRIGLVIGLLVVIYYGALYFPSSLMQRPHYSLWRIVLAGSICYCAIITFILFQNKEDINMFFKTFFDPRLGEPLPERSYAEDCRIYTPENPHSRFANVWGTMDVFISAHFFGWFFKMLVVRDWKFCTFLSIFFEFLEKTFEHWLPNFSECWWDSLLLDVAICNGLGIYVGHLFIQRFQMKQFKWTRNIETNQKSIVGNFIDFVRSVPIDKQDWHIFSSTKRFLSVLYYIALMYSVDLSNFFNKYVLWIPASHYLLTIRIFLWGFLSLVCTKEYYEYISNNMFFRLGPFLFIGHVIIFVEYSILYKFSRGYFTAPFPKEIVWAWAIIFISVVVITSILLYRDIKRKFYSNEQNIKKKAE